MEIIVDKENRGFCPDAEWMSRRYDEMNRILFNGSLGGCSFVIFTSGRGSQGRTLGVFGMTARGLKCDRYTRKIFKESFSNGIFMSQHVGRHNFESVCRPQIALNGNYTGTEYGFLATLVHEMCHYYTYMDGKAPTQAHGPEFYRIGDIVSEKSGGLFTIQRLATAEEMAHLELNDEMKEKRERRVANKKASVCAVFDFRAPSDVRLTITKSQELINTICSFGRSNKYSEKIVLTRDANVIDLLFSKGYSKSSRTWRYWQITDNEILSALDNADKQVIENPNMNECKKSLDDIISEAINKIVLEMSDDSESAVDILPGMNLGLLSPLENEGGF